LHMELLRDIAQLNVLFTLSYWEDVAALERSRQSELFRTTWAKTKVLFADRAQAWTVELVEG
ncbi:MAG: antibiotic biosynthesis monooxygenase, partial [Saprospiraceae bacterium]|nr:antibiotic biosynthesis monooxygenase [Saprospiraceae bacterium]